eukprot:m.1327853 g.1327853  ORF g.1327853 m.1327853 type:complete len:309 (+) comp24858_c0_seq61:319-1245(+)
MPEDALRLKAGVNQSPGGVNAPGATKTKNGKTWTFPRMRSGWYCKDGVRISQEMHFSEDHVDEKLRGVFKGTLMILRERGLVGWNETLKGKCSSDGHRDDNTCCCERLLGSQEDFREQSSKLEELVGKTRHKIKMLPKFHPELNPIEMYWGQMKVYTRKHCNYSFRGLQKTLPKALDSVTQEQVERFWEKSKRFEYMYFMESSCGVAMPFFLRNFCMKKYKGHRGVSMEVSTATDSWDEVFEVFRTANENAVRIVEGLEKRLDGIPVTEKTMTGQHYKLRQWKEVVMKQLEWFRRELFYSKTLEGCMR